MASRGRSARKSIVERALSAFLEERPPLLDTRGKKHPVSTMSLGRSFFSRVSYIRTEPSRVESSRWNATLFPPSPLGNVQYASRGHDAISVSLSDMSEIFRRARGARKPLCPGLNYRNSENSRNTRENRSKNREEQP